MSSCSQCTLNKETMISETLHESRLSLNYALFTSALLLSEQIRNTKNSQKCPKLARIDPQDQPDTPNNKNSQTHPKIASNAQRRPEPTRHT